MLDLSDFNKLVHIFGECQLDVVYFCFVNASVKELILGPCLRYVQVTKKKRKRKKNMVISNPNNIKNIIGINELL